MKTPRTDKYKGTWASTRQDGISIFQHGQKLERELSELAKENHRLRIALHESINSPKGIVPHEAEEFYDQDFYSTTTAQ